MWMTILYVTATHKARIAISKWVGSSGMSERYESHSDVYDLTLAEMRLNVLFAIELGYNVTIKVL